jgi:hypothetical protein
MESTRLAWFTNELFGEAAALLLLRARQPYF